MGSRCYHSTSAARSIVFGVVALCASGGCWQEIEYTGPDPSEVARRERPRPAVSERTAETESPATTEPSDREAGKVADREPLPPAEPEPPTVATELPDSAAERSAPDDEDPVSSDLPLDDTEPDLFPPDDTETIREPPIAEQPPLSPTAATRLAAWQLGSKLTLAALAHDRGLVPSDAEKWLAEARAAAQTLATSIADLPEPAAADERESGSRRVHDYLFQQGQRIWRELTERHGADHAALFEAAVKSNVLLVLYEPGSSAVDALADSIRAAAPQAVLPAKLWRPLLDQLADGPPPAAVRFAVRQMHADVEQYLNRTAE